MTDTSIYYDYNKIMSYNALINILIGERRVGKTYGATKFVTNKYKKNKEEFAYIRRYKSELAEAVPKFFDPLIENKEFDNKLTTKGNSFYFDGDKFGHAMTLSTAQKLKGSNFNKVTTIIFDEFIIEKGQKTYYLQNEVVNFLSLMLTLSSYRDVKVIMLANNADLTNPYFLYFDLSIPYGNDIKLFKDGLILVQKMVNQAFREEMSKTKWGQLIESTDYGNYALNNEELGENLEFLKKKSGSSKFSFAFTVNGETFGVWNDYKEGVVIVSKDWDKKTPYNFALTLSDHKPNFLYIKTAKKFICFKNFVQNYNMGLVFYESKKIKSAVQNAIKLLLTN